MRAGGWQQEGDAKKSPMANRVADVWLVGCGVARPIREATRTNSDVIGPGLPNVTSDWMSELSLMCSCQDGRYWKRQRGSRMIGAFPVPDHEFMSPHKQTEDVTENLETKLTKVFSFMKKKLV